MGSPSPIPLTPETLNRLGRSLRRLPETISFREDPLLSSWVASAGIHREVGTLNDEIARFLFDADTGMVIPRSSLKSQLVSYAGTIGCEIVAMGYPRLEIRVRGLKALLHPKYSFNPDGTCKALVLFPLSISKILESQGVEAVLVRDWGLNTIFGGFDPSKHYYQTNFWELENNDTLRFAKLLEQRRLPVLGTHDVVAHIANVAGSHWDELSETSHEVRDLLESYFQQIKTPTIASLVLPYTAGVILDDLAQPPSYGDPTRRLVLSEVLGAIRSDRIPASDSHLLMKFPSHYEKVIRFSRGEEPKTNEGTAEDYVSHLVNEILANSVQLPASRGAV